MSKTNHPLYGVNFDDVLDFLKNGKSNAPKIHKDTLNYINSNEFSKKDYHSLLTGEYDLGAGEYESLASILKDHKLNNEKNNDAILDKIINNKEEPFWKRGRLEEFAKHFPLSESSLLSLIRNHKKTSDDSQYDISDIISSNRNTNENHLKELVNNTDKIDHKAIDHPKITPEIIKDAIDKNKLDDIGLSKVYDKHVNTPFLDEKTAEKALRYLNRTKAYQATKDKYWDLVPSEKREKAFNEVLGIHGGKHKYDKDEVVDDNDFIYDNWKHGEKYNEEHANSVAESKHLTPAQVEHIKQHGTTDQKWNLFNNPHIDPKHSEEMYNKWLNDDHSHGYDLDEFKDKLKEEHGDLADHYDDYHEDARNQAEEEYPYEDFLKDNDYNDEYFADSSEDDFKNNYLENNYDWSHEDNDYSENKESHPDYKLRTEEANKAWEDEVSRGKDEKEEDLFSQYDEHLSERIYDIAQDMHNDKIDSIHRSIEAMPDHLPVKSRFLKNKELLSNPDTDEKTVDQILKEKNPLELHELAIKHPNVNPDTLKWASEEFDHLTPENKELAEDYYKASDRYEDPDKVHVAMNTNKLRQARDFVEEKGKGGVVHKKDLEKAGFNLKSLGIDKYVDPKGIISSKEIQGHIDSMPKTKYGVTESDWNGSQRHSDKKSKVFQLNASPEHFKKMKEAGVLNTFKRMLEDFNSSGHPVNKNRGIGWVRYTEGDDGVHVDEIQTDFGQNFVKQIESQAKQLAREARQNGINHVQMGEQNIDVNDLEDRVNNLKSKYPNIDKEAPIISKIMFGGEHPSKILHEAFHEHLRSNGKAGKKVHIWTPESKAPISGQTTEHELDNLHISSAINSLKEGKKDNISSSLYQWGAKNKIVPSNIKEANDDYLENLRSKAQSVASNEGILRIPANLPVHMRETYGDQPKEMGYKPSTYGQLSTQENDEHAGKSTQETIVRKTLEGMNDLLKKELSIESKVKIAQSLQMIKENQQTMEHIRETSPEVYESIAQLSHSLVLALKEHSGETPESIAQDIQQYQQQEQQQEGQPQNEDQSQVQQQESTGIGHRLATKDKPITNRKQVYQPGEVRQYDAQTVREKMPDGSWKSVASGLKGEENG